MTKRTPVVFGDNNALHEPLVLDDKLPTNSIPVSANSGNAVAIKSDGLFCDEPSELSTIQHDYSLNGNGSNNYPLSVRVSNLNDNVIKMQRNGNDHDGLYIPDDTFLKSIQHDNTLSGDGTNARSLYVNVSNKEHNRMKLTGAGLYVSPATTMKYADTMAPILCEGPDNLSEETACGKFGKGVYWKKKVTLTNARKGDNNIRATANLLSLPCKSDGTLVHYQLRIEYPTIRATDTPYIYLYLICMEIPTHFITLSGKYIAKIYRGVAIMTPTGLDDIYDAANPGNGPYYSLQYIYAA